MSGKIHVSSLGNDSNAGGSDAPVKTIAESLRRLAGCGGGEIVLADQTHYVGETLKLGPEHSGTSERPLVIRGEGEARSVISGGRRVECRWEESGRGAGGSLQSSGRAQVLSCDMSRHTDVLDAVDQMYVNGRRQVKARYPNGDSRNPDRSAYISVTGADEFPHSEVYFEPGTLGALGSGTWRRPEEAVLHIFPGNHWGNMQYRLRDVDFETGVLKLGEGGHQLYEKRKGRPGAGGATRIDERSRFFVENVFEELDTPGEWYLDRAEARLYWIPEPGVDPDDAVVELAVLSHLIEVTGRDGSAVDHVEFQGLAFAHARSTFLEPYVIPSAGDWSIYPGGAVRFEGASSCAVVNCDFTGVGGNGVYVTGRCEGIRVSRSTFVDIGESAVCLVGRSHLVPDGQYTCPICGGVSSWEWGEPSDEFPSHCVVEDNLIHDIGVFGKQTAGVYMALSSHNVVRHNHIYNTPRAAVCINDGLHGGHLIEGNDIHDTVRETGDHGPFNSWGREPFWCHAQSHGGESHPAGDVLRYAAATTEITRNRFRDSSGWGIDLDDGSSNYHVHSNLCIGISVKLREGDHRLVENNIFYKGVNPPAFHRGYEENRDRFVRNIVVSDTDVDLPEVDANFRKAKSKGAVYDIIDPPEKGPWVGEWDFNLCWSNIGRFLAWVHKARNEPKGSVAHSLEQWRALGHDRHGGFADPNFRDPEGGDFRLSEDSPALTLGFRPFPLDQFGIRSAGLGRNADHDNNLSGSTS